MASCYHITNFNNIEKCMEGENCRLPSTLHFSTMAEALIEMNNWNFYCESRDKSVRRYNNLINYLSGDTEHYKSSRVIRERELKRLLGKGEARDRFLVERVTGELEIHEVLSNGVVKIYSYYTNKQITTFAPSPERIMSLYHAIGEFPPEEVIERSEKNFLNGYNEIMNK